MSTILNNYFPDSGTEEMIPKCGKCGKWRNCKRKKKKQDALKQKIGFFIK